MPLQPCNKLLLLLVLWQVLSLHRPRWRWHLAPPRASSGTTSSSKPKQSPFARRPLRLLVPLEPVQVSPWNTTCLPAADLAKLKCCLPPIVSALCRALQTSYAIPTPSPPRHSTSPRTYLKAAKGRTLERTRGPRWKGILPDQIHCALSGRVSERGRS